MRELILNLHGIGEPHDAVDEKEKEYWSSTAAVNGLLDQITDRQGNSDLKIAITFDDGNASDALVALPALTGRKLTASFFVCAGRVGIRNYLDRFMIKDLVDSGMIIGSHGMAHLNWRTLNDFDLEVEISDARHKLEDIIQRPITTVAIPFGFYDRRVLNRLLRDTWKCIYTTDGGFSCSSERVKPRQTVRAAMYDESLLHRLCIYPPARVRLRRKLSRLYKRLR
jgi:peptidoglycan/xylan/chitin deacetylase (PgdA/CDA1 family)